MENVLLDTVMVRTRISNSPNSTTASVPSEEITSGNVSDIIDPETGEAVSFQEYIKKEELPDENIISDSDFNSIFGN